MTNEEWQRFENAVETLRYEVARLKVNLQKLKPAPRELYAIYDRTTGVFMGAQPNPFGGTAVNTVKFREVIE